MKIWLISQDVNNGWDAYDAAVVAAESEADAKTIHPAGVDFFVSETWCQSPEQVTAICLGNAIDGTARGVILASFNSG